MERRPLFRTPVISKSEDMKRQILVYKTDLVFLNSKCSLSLLAFRKDHEKAEFEVHEVYAVDVLISTGEGKVKIRYFYMYLMLLFLRCLPLTQVILITSLCLQARDSGQRTTVYKRDPSKQYGLKMKTSRMFFSEVERRFDTMPFTLRY